MNLTSSLPNSKNLLQPIGNASPFCLSNYLSLSSHTKKDGHLEDLPLSGAKYSTSKVQNVVEEVQNASYFESFLAERSCIEALSSLLELNTRKVDAKYKVNLPDPLSFKDHNTRLTFQ